MTSSDPSTANSTSFDIGDIFATEVFEAGFLKFITQISGLNETSFRINGVKVVSL